MNEEVETVINNEYDYSTIIPSGEAIGYIVQYCENLYTQFTTLVNNDERKNETLKYEYKNYEYGKHFKSEFTVTIKKSGLNNIICKSYSSYLDVLNSGNINNVNGLDIIMDLSYKRGDNTHIIEHRNDFKVIFRPYDIRFIRKSNHNENNMNQIENSINAILKQFPTANSIFYSK